MIKAAQASKRSLECLRLEVACKELADGVSNAKLRSHLVRMARFWSDLAYQGVAEPNIADMTCANVLAA